MEMPIFPNEHGNEMRNTRWSDLMEQVEGMCEETAKADSKAQMMCHLDNIADLLILQVSEMVRSSAFSDNEKRYIDTLGIMVTELTTGEIANIKRRSQATQKGD